MHAWEPFFKQELASIYELAVQPFRTIFENVHVTLGQLFSLSSSILRRPLESILALLDLVLQSDVIV